MERLLAEINPANNPLLAPVHIPDDENAVLRSNHPAVNILAQPGLVVISSQFKTMNGLPGLEQATRYVLLDPRGAHVGYMAEHDGLDQRISPRQWFRTHRAFTTHIFDRQSQEVLRFHRAFSLINTQIRVYDAAFAANSKLSGADNDLHPQHGLSRLPMDAMAIVGELCSRWALMRCKYDLSVSQNPMLNKQSRGSASRKPVNALTERQGVKTSLYAPFASINEHSMSWNFSLTSEAGKRIGAIDRRFHGFAHESFTHAGSYVFHMDSAAVKQEAQIKDLTSETIKVNQTNDRSLSGKENKHGMTLDQRAVMLASAVTVNFDYFSKQGIGDGADLLLLGMPGRPVSIGAGQAGGISGGTGGGTGGAGNAVGGVGSGHGVLAGAGSLAGYDAMQRGMGQGSSLEAQDTGQQVPPPEPQYSPSPDTQDQQGDVWGEGSSDPWGETGPSGAGGGGGEGGGGWFQWFWDLFT